MPERDLNPRPPADWPRHMDIFFIPHSLNRILKIVGLVKKKKIRKTKRKFGKQRKLGKKRKTFLLNL